MGVRRRETWLRFARGSQNYKNVAWLRRSVRLFKCTRWSAGVGWYRNCASQKKDPPRRFSNVDLYTLLPCTDRYHNVDLPTSWFEGACCLKYQRYVLTKNAESQTWGFSYVRGNKTTNNIRFATRQYWKNQIRSCNLNICLDVWTVCFHV